MSNELVPQGVTLPAVNGAIGAASSMFTELTKSKDYFDRIQLYTKGAAIDQGKIGPGRYGVPVAEGEINDLGDEIDIVPLVCRPKALDMSDRDAVIVSYDRDSSQFKGIEAKAGVKDSGCMAGVTFLVYERSTGEFYEFFCGNKSMKNEAPKIGAYLALSDADAALIEEKTGKAVEAHGPLPCTLETRYVTKGSWGWHVPVCKPCSTPFANAPTPETLVKKMNDFAAQKSSDVEVVEDAPAGGRAR